MTATLVLRVVSDVKDAVQGMSTVESTSSRMGTAMQKAALPAAAVGAAVIGFGKAAVDSASRTQQAMGAVESVFGSSASTIKRWAANAADSVGLARSEYGELASVIGSQLKNMGLPMDQVVGKTGDLIRMGADLAATYGGTTKEAVEALGSALRGETDPIERYGISVKAADVAAQRAADGTDKLTGAAGKAADANALLTLVTQQAADANGQFAREADSAAGSAQIMAANYENAKSTIGTALLPLVAAFASKLADVAKWAQKNSTLVQVLVGVLGGLAAAVLAVNAALKVYQATLIVVQAVQKATWLTNPIGLVLVAVIALVAGIVLLWKKSETFRTIVLAVWRAVRTAAETAGRAIKTVFLATWKAITSAGQAVGRVVAAVFRAVADVATTVAGRVREVFHNGWEAIKSGVRDVASVIRAVLGAVRTVAQSVASSVREKFAGLWDALASRARALAGVLTRPFDAVRSAVNNAISAVQSLISWLGRIHVPKISLPDIPGFGRAAPTVTTAPGAGPRVGFRAAGTVGGRASSSGGNVIINVSGAIDPEATARQIRRILDSHDRRVGLRVTA